MRIIDFRQLRKNSLLGFVRIELSSGLILNDVSILTGPHGFWASPPGKPQIDRDGNVLREPTGRIKYSAVVEFKTRELRTRWSDEVIAALKASNPEAFEA